MTFLEMLALWLVIGVPIAVGMVVGNSFGSWLGVGAGLLSALVFAAIVGFAYRASWRKNAQRRRELREKYRRIYRVIGIPTDERSISKPQGVEIRVGDYGWEAAPLRDDGLIYLQGLNLQWRVVWYAGFRPDQIENVALKPQSQYDWNSTWFRNPPICPFPLQGQQTTDLGLPRPVKIERVAV